ncbi:5-hydroxytryptamine receptor-like [Oncorhynchus masou masou]|uniref:5-hydroxytryptamine receptor-like n=1 Tax=Oncorhynchus masou masou TaxID=90313 RepID=UPI0031836B3E
MRAVCLLTPTARERGQKRTEGKLAKRFGYIIITFTLFWMPMVVILLIHAIVTRGRDSSWVLKELETSAMILTCVPVAVDPLIYTMVTRQFRSEFSKLLSSLHRRG